jgi:histidinol dehydrogenase
LFKFELGCGEMENRIVTRSLKKQLNQVVLHEQVENGIAISNNLSADHVDQRFETPRRVFQIKQKHLQTKDRPIGHIMP